MRLNNSKIKQNIASTFILTSKISGNPFERASPFPQTVCAPSTYLLTSRLVTSDAERISNGCYKQRVALEYDWRLYCTCRGDLKRLVSWIDTNVVSIAVVF